MLQVFACTSPLQTRKYSFIPNCQTYGVSKRQVLVLSVMYSASGNPLALSLLLYWFIHDSVCIMRCRKWKSMIASPCFQLYPVSPVLSFSFLSFPLVNINHLVTWQALAIQGKHSLLLLLPPPPSLSLPPTLRMRGRKLEHSLEIDRACHISRMNSDLRWLWEWTMNDVLFWFQCTTASTIQAILQLLSMVREVAKCSSKMNSIHPNYVDACFLMKFLRFSLLREKGAHLVCQQHPLLLNQSLWTSCRFKMSSPFPFKGLYYCD